MAVLLGSSLGEKAGQPWLALGLLAHVADAVLLALVAEPVWQGRQALRQVILQGDEQVRQGAPQAVVLAGVDLEVDGEGEVGAGKKNSPIYMSHRTYILLPCRCTFNTSSYVHGTTAYTFFGTVNEYREMIVFFLRIHRLQ